MGIRMTMDAPGSSSRGDAFSEDILKIEINGPEVSLNSLVTVNPLSSSRANIALAKSSHCD